MKVGLSGSQLRSFIRFLVFPVLRSMSVFPGPATMPTVPARAMLSSIERPAFGRGYSWMSGKAVQFLPLPLQ